MLAQLWEAKLEQENFNFSPSQVEEINTFMQLRPGEQDTYDYVDLIRNIRQIINDNGGDYFVEELADLNQLIYRDGPFQRACFFLEALRMKLSKQGLSPAEIPELCARAEDSLAALFEQLGFLARYTLTAVQTIDVQKFRHNRKATFNHKAVFLTDLLGGLEVTYFERERFTDNRSVLLIKGENMDFLNLSPFIIDANAFEEDADLSKIYFISYYEPTTDSYRYKYVNRPDLAEEQLTIPQKNFDIVKIQLDAFKELLGVEA